MTRRLVVLAAVFAVAVIGACNENLDSGAVCPSLCPAQNVAIHDTLIDPVLLFDSTYVGFPERGTELEMLLATRGDTLEVRGVVRFDTLTFFYTPAGDTSHTIVHIDSSRVRLVLDRIGSKIPSSVTFEVYDVDDTVSADTSTAAVLSLFRASQRIGRRTFLKDSLTDTLFVPLSDSAVLDKVFNKRHLRLGLRLSGSGSVSLRVLTTEGGNPAQVLYHPTTTDTTIKLLSVSPYSSTPVGVDLPEVQQDLTDYEVVAKYAFPQYPNTMDVGGIPGRRSYLRFSLPSYITDSNTVVRATLMLTQRPLPFGDASDTMIVHAHVALAGPDVHDLRRATNIITSSGLLVSDSLLVTPRDSGLKTIEMYSLLRAWGNQRTLVNAPPRAVVLRASPEALLPLESRFFSSSAPAGLRPVMRISYIPRVNFGVP
ncbi:MAG: hypothetical protein ACHQQ3_13240 [Gemmatimonadales bacterium]